MRYAEAPAGDLRENKVEPESVSIEDAPVYKPDKYTFFAESHTTPYPVSVTAVEPSTIREYMYVPDGPNFVTMDATPLDV